MIEIVIPGTPVAKGRPRFARRGNFVSTYTPEKTANYENLVSLYASQAMNGAMPLDGALSVTVLLYLTPPASWSQKKQAAAIAQEIRPTSKPDLDNTIKGIFDACNEIVWKDDKQIVELLVTKRYDAKAMACVQVEEYQQ